MAERKILEISLNRCFKIFEQSFNRVKYFSVINENISKELFPNEWLINNPSGISYVMKEVPENKKDELEQGYKHFIQCYLVRDCIESFAISLDNLFYYLLINGKRVPFTLSEQEKGLITKFKNAGLHSQYGKVQQLKKLFDLEISKDHEKIITSLKDIRNCFAHNNGFVRNIDGKKDNKTNRKFHWFSFSISGVGIKTGKEFEVKFNEPLEEESNIIIKIIDNKKSFKIGNQLTFSDKESYEIGLSLQFVARAYLSEISKKGINSL